MAKILVVFTANHYPVRQTFEDLLVCFMKNENHSFYYFNVMRSSIPLWIRHNTFDAVIFTHSITMCGDRDRYSKMISLLKDIHLNALGIRVAMFQDEYFNTDMFVQFINALEIDIVFSVAPESEWPLIYNGIRTQVKIFPMLTGYIEERRTLPYDELFVAERTIDVSYRVGWDAFSVVLGEFSCDKKRIAELFIAERIEDLSNFRIDVKVGGQHYILGDKWFEFLKKCRFVLGVESGSSVIDVDASMRTKVIEYCSKHPDVEWREVYDFFVKEHDYSLKLFTLSPRHFEAIQCGTCQILYEGNYSGILKPYEHYIPLKKDHSNFDEIINILSNEECRKSIVRKVYEDIILSGKYTYDEFVKYFFSKVKPPESALTAHDRLILLWSRISLWIGWKVVIRLISALKGRGLLEVMKKSSIGRPVLAIYYKLRS